jgi:hypothetical protein
LERLEREQHAFEYQRWVREHAVAERLAQLRRVGRAAHLVDDRVGIRIRHLVRREQRHARLVVRGLRAAVPVAPARRPLIDAVVPIGIEGMLGEWRHVLHVRQRRHGAQPGAWVAAAALRPVCG